MALLLAIALTLCAICIIILQAYNNQLSKSVTHWKEAHTYALEEARQWESRYWRERTNIPDNGEAIVEDAPRSHDVPDVDVEKVMAESDDPVWDVVIGCRGVGTMNYWLNRVRPDLKDAMPHRKYGEFASYILQLPEDQRTVDGVTAALSHGAR